MTSIANPGRPTVSFCPSSVCELFSVQYNGKTHDLPCWQKTAIVITGIAGIALFGIGVLLGFCLSYCLRNRLVEQLCASQPNPAVVKDPGEPKQAPQLPTVDQMPLVAEAPVENNPAPVEQPDQPNPTPLEQPVAPNADADRLLRLADQFTERGVKSARAKIDALRTFSKGKPTFINGKTLDQLSVQGRHFVFIRDGYMNFQMPDFSPLALPKGVYCVYTASTPRIALAYSVEFNKVMEDEFGAENLYHLIIFNQVVKPAVEKLHNHQLELTAGPGNAQVNADNLATFKQEVALRDNHE